jgi:hypothetical protein
LSLGIKSFIKIDSKTEYLISTLHKWCSHFYHYKLSYFAFNGHAQGDLSFICKNQIVGFDENGFFEAQNLYLKNETSPFSLEIKTGWKW